MLLLLQYTIKLRTWYAREKKVKVGVNVAGIDVRYERITFFENLA